MDVEVPTNGERPLRGRFEWNANFHRGFRNTNEYRTRQDKKNKHDKCSIVRIIKFLHMSINIILRM